MSYGNNQKSFAKSNVVYFNFRSKDKDGQKVRPYFEVSRYDTDAKKVKKTDETCTNIKGDLVKIVVEDTKIKNVDVKQATLILRDAAANELYVVKNPFRMDTRSLYNSVINLNTPENLSISVYENKKGFSTFSVRQNDTSVNWKYAFEELPEPNVVEFKGKPMRDFSPVDNLLGDELVKLNDRLFGKAKDSKVTVPTQSKTEDIPF